MDTKLDLKQHLIDRGMNPDLYPVSYDHDESVVTFFLHNGTGDIVGYQQYRPLTTEKKVKNDPKNGRYYTYLPKDTDGVFGWDVINPADRTIYVVEGIFKAAVLHRLGHNAIAVLTSSPKRLKPWFRILRPIWNLVAIGDNDPAGQILINCVKKGFKSPVDLDEMLDEDIVQMLRVNAAGGSAP